MVTVQGTNDDEKQTFCAVSALGVSNFDVDELRELWQMARVKPAVVQRNSDPLNPDTLVQLYARLIGMQYQVCTPAQSCPGHLQLLYVNKYSQARFEQCGPGEAV